MGAVIETRDPGQLCLLVVLLDRVAHDDRCCCEPLVDGHSAADHSATLRRYPLLVLAFLAAVVPIIGSLYVGCSFLIQQNALVHEQRVRVRIKPMVEARYERDKEKAAARLGVVPFDDLLAERERFERLLLEANGVYGAGMTWDDFDLHHSMSGTVLPQAERRCQWVLLASSAIGLVLLAIDTL